MSGLDCRAVIVQPRGQKDMDWRWDYSTVVEEKTFA